jgi:hypothetical protein
MPKQPFKNSSDEQELGPYQELSEAFVSVPLSSEQPGTSHPPFVLEDEDLFSSALEHQNNNSNSTKEDSVVDNLYEMLGTETAGLSKEDIRLLLDIYDGDVDRVASCLLEQDNVSTLQLVKDFRLARSLQAEEEQQQPRTFTDVPQEDTPTARPLPASSRERFIYSVKEILIPQLANELVGMQFPDIENDGPKYEYHLRGLSLQDITIPIDQVQVTVTHPDILVDCENVELKIAIGQWEYHRKGTLSFQDDGEASVDLSGIRVGLSIRSYVEQEGMEVFHLRVRKCTVSVEQVRFRFKGTKAGWLYNLLSTIFQSQLKKHVEAVLQTTVSNAVDSQLHSWTQWIFAE